MTRRSAWTRTAPTLPTLIALVAATGCQPPNFEGAQIQNPPRGFLMQNDSYQQRRVFPEREVVQHFAWINAGNGPYSAIYIDAHQGALTRDDVAAAREAGRLAAPNPETTFGEVETLTIDGRTAWGWPERLETERLGLDWVAYRAVVPYDTISYAIEFYGGDPLIKMAAPDTLRTVISSFAVGRTEWNLPLIAVIGGVLLLGVSVARSQAQQRAARLRSINLVKIEKKKSEDAAAAAGAATPAPAAQRPAAATTAGPAAVRSTPRPAPPGAPPAPPASPTRLREGGPRGSGPAS